MVGSGKERKKYDNDPSVSVDKLLLRAELKKLLPKILKIFETEPAVIKIDTINTMVVGDIHGDFEALSRVLEYSSKLDCEHIVFLGDYVDRGKFGLEVLVELFMCKIENKERFILLRGNHEDILMNQHYGFLKELGENIFSRGYPRDEDLLELLGKVYDAMPIAVVLNNATFCVHGGISNGESVDHITKTNSYQYLWNDPSCELGKHKSDRGPDIYNYGPDIVDKFLETNGLIRIIRGHTFIEEGYRFMFDNKLLSIFTATDYVDTSCDGAFVVLGKDNEKLKVYPLKNSGE